MDTADEGTSESRVEQEWRDRKESIGLAFFWLITLAYGFFVPSIINWNTESHLYPAFAIVDHHTVAIDAYHQGLGDQSYAHGHYYTDKAPGLSFLAVPVYAAMRVVFPSVRATGFKLYKHRAGYYYIPAKVAFLRYGITFLLLSLPSAALAVLLWIFLMRISPGVGWPLSVAATYALGTTAYVYSIWYFSHQICAILLFTAFFLIFSYVRYKPWRRNLFLITAAAGLLAGYSIISEYPTAVIVLMLGIYLAVVAMAKKLALLGFAAGMVPAAALNLLYNTVAFGKPFAMGYAYVHSSTYHSHVHTGILGLANPLSYGVQAPSLRSFWEITFGSYRGIFLLCPVLLLFFAGIRFMWRRTDLRPEFWLCVAIVVIYFLIDASRGQDTNGWSGGASVASRHLVPMLPFMVIPIVFGLGNLLFRLTFAVLAVVSIVIMFMTVASTYLFSYTDHNPLVNEVFHNFFKGYVVSNWVSIYGRGMGLDGPVTLIPLLLVAAILVGRIWWLLRREPQPSDEGSRVAELTVS